MNIHIICVCVRLYLEQHDDHKTTDKGTEKKIHHPSQEVDIITDTHYF